MKLTTMRYRWKLQLAIMLVVGGAAAGVLAVVERRAAAEAERAMHAEFSGAVAVLRSLHSLRYAVLVERCRTLVRKPRLHAALEDSALDLLYPTARDELRDFMEDEDEEEGEGEQHASYGLHGEFYRFLDRHGAVIDPGAERHVGRLLPAETAQLALPGVPAGPEFGYLLRSQNDDDGPIFDLIAMPIQSSESGEVIAALVIGFEPASTLAPPPEPGNSRGIWVGGRLLLTRLSDDASRQVAATVARMLAAGRMAADGVELEFDGERHLMFFARLNPGSRFPPAYEVSLFPLGAVEARQRELRRQVLGVGGLVLLLGLGVSHVVAGRLARPVEQLAQVSEEARAERQKAEAALEQTSEELQRAARFSADASHQLKTPVAVLRAGLEELAARDGLGAESREEIAALIRQTYRLSGVIEDLLLLSRLDAGRLKIDFGTVDLSQLVAAALDDLSVRPDPFGLEVETDVPEPLLIVAEKRYADLILQNLVENAGKYNRSGGRIRFAGRRLGDRVELVVGNTGRPMPAEAQAHVFERFHRGGMGENVPGYGLGLNLARELARLHGGDLSLVRSADDWTEFAVTFCAASEKEAG